MSLETIVGSAEDMMNKYINKAPWWTRLFYYNEIKEAKKIMSNAKDHLSNHTNNRKWYLQAGGLLNSAYDLSYSTINKTYDLINAVNSIREKTSRIPIIKRFVDNFFSRSDYKGIKKIPKIKSAYEIVDNAYKTGLSILCATAETNTGINYDDYWNNIKRKAKPVEKKKPVFYDYLKKTINSIGSFVSEMFGNQPAYNVR